MYKLKMTLNGKLCRIFSIKKTANHQKYIMKIYHIHHWLSCVLQSNYFVKSMPVNLICIFFSDTKDDDTNVPGIEICRALVYQKIVLTNKKEVQCISK